MVGWKIMSRIAFDVDDTLIKHEPGKESCPDYGIISVLKWFVNNGHQVLVWSGGGVDYASMWVRKLGIQDIVTVVTKEDKYDVDIAFDDHHVELAKVTIKVPRDYYTGETNGFIC